MIVRLKRFKQKDLRWDFYPMMSNLMKKGLKIEAYILMLSTWNFARFRYAIKSFNLDNFVRVAKKLEPYFKKFEGKKLKTLNLDKYKKDILKIFTELSSIKGIEKTGTPKLMHLRVPEVFVMWDTFIRNHYKFKRGDAEDYFEFLKLMQQKFGNINKSPNRTLAKLIDEHNFITITQKAMRK